MPTKQETFDTVVAHLRKQGCKSENDDGCAYRGDGGLMCAAGCLIPDEKYNPKWEGFDVSYVPIKNMFMEIGHDLWLLNELQMCHDHVDVDNWEYKFSKIAAGYNLTYTPPATP